MNSDVRAAFPATLGQVHLNTAYMGPCPIPVIEAGKSFLDRRSRGAGTVEDWCAVADQTREQVAALIGASASEIAFLGNTSEGTNIVASAVDWRAGDNVAWDDLDHSTNKLVWLDRQRRHGVESRVVRSRDGAVSATDYERLVDGRTRVISISLVTPQTGFLEDVRALADLAHAHGAWLHVDAAQALGAIRVNVRETGIDSLTAGAYKWLLGPIGLAVFFVREELLDREPPMQRGWMQVKSWDNEDTDSCILYHAAKKFESATPNFQGVHELQAALHYTREVGWDRIQDCVLQLSARLRERLSIPNVTLITPPGARSGIVSCAVPDGVRAARSLADMRVVAKTRDNAVRFSPHFFNLEGEIEIAGDAIERAVR